MGCRGVHFAIDDSTAARLLQAGSDEERMYVVQEIEERWDEEYLYQTDKAWDAIHRCLTDGKLSFAGGSYPLNRCILGGRSLYEGDDYILVLISPEEVRHLSESLPMIDRSEFHRRYFQIDPKDYGLPLSEEDFEYTWDWFDGLAAFFQMASAKGRAVIFTVDQ